MNLDQLQGLTRALMTAIGGMLVGHYFITASVWEGLTGAALAAGGLGWGVYQKSLMLDQVASAVRAMMGGLGGYAVQRGWITSDQLTAWIGVGLASVPVVWSYVYHATPAAPAAPSVPVARIDSHWIVGLAIIGLTLMLGGCANLTTQQQANLQLELALAKQVGADAVKIWCAASGIIYVIADAETGNKPNPTQAVSYLRNNAAAAATACPLISQVTSIQTAIVPPAGATPSPITGG